VAAIEPNGGTSEDSIRATFKYVNEPAVIYHTLDGSTPTLVSTTWEAKGPRQPGQVFLVKQNTTVKWIAKDIRGNTSGVSEAIFIVEKMAVITITAPAGKTYGDAPFQVSATASTTQIVSFSSQTPGVCSVSGTTVTILTAGDCIVRAFTQASPGFGAAFKDATIVIAPQGATATYTGPQYVSTAAGSTANVNLSATFQDVAAFMNGQGVGGYEGDIRTATVNFVNRDAGNAVLCTSAPIQLADPGNVLVGVASCTWQADIGAADSVQYTVGVVVRGNYARNAPEDNAIVTVAKAVPGSISGGGHLINQLSGGVKAGSAGRLTDFGFHVKNVKSGANFIGGASLVIRSGGLTYQVKSTGISSLVINRVSPLPGMGSFSGKAAITDITDQAAPVVVEAVATLQVIVNDYGEPGSSDMLGITLWDKSGKLWFSSRWNSRTTVQQTVGGGNAETSP
jgi:hypothetical protein